MPDLKLRQFRYFVEIAEQGSFTRAARKIGIAQPALSRHIAETEAQIGARLLERSPRGVRTTEAGDRFLRHARTILRQVDLVEKEIRHLDEDPRGEVVVAITGGVSTFIAAPLINSVAAQYPEIHISVRESMAAHSYDLMERGHADLALLPNGHLIRGVEARTCLNEHLYFGGLRIPELDSDSPIDLETVCRYPLVMQTRSHFARDSLEQAAFNAGLRPNIRHEQDSGRLFISYLEAGLGWAVGPWQAFHRHHADRRFIARKVVNPVLSRPLTIAWRADTSLPKAVLVVKDHLQALVEDLLARGILRGNCEADQQ